MNYLSILRSQLNNLITFKNLFSIDKILMKSVYLIRDYCSRSGRAVFPWTINLLVTMRCNLRCKMCAVQQIRNIAIDELRLYDIRRFVQGVSKYKPVFFIGGGEPFAREDLIDIVRVVKENDLPCGIVTNGTLLDKNKISELISLGLEDIIFSLYGRDEIHEEITGVKGSFDKTFNNIKLFCKLRKKTKVIINCVITEWNYLSLEDVVKIGKDLKVDLVRFEFMNFMTTTEAQRHYNFGKERFKGRIELTNYYIENLKNSDGMSEELLRITTHIKRKYKNFVLFKPHLTPLEIKSWYSEGFKNLRKCLFLWNSVFIKPDGKVSPCQFLLDFELGNIKKEKLEKIWNTDRYRQLRLSLKKELFPGCIRCCKL